MEMEMEIAQIAQIAQKEIELRLRELENSKLDLTNAIADQRKESVKILMKWEAKQKGEIEEQFKKQRQELLQALDQLSLSLETPQDQQETPKTKTTKTTKTLQTPKIPEILKILEIQARKITRVHLELCPPPPLSTLQELFFRLQSSVTCPVSTCLSGPDLTAMHPGKNSILISSWNGQKQPRVSGGDEFLVEFLPEVKFDLLDKRNGTYELNYWIPNELATNEVKLSVRLEGKHLQNSPTVLREQLLPLGCERTWQTPWKVGAMVASELYLFYINPEVQKIFTSSHLGILSGAFPHLRDVAHPRALARDKDTTYVLDASEKLHVFVNSLPPRTWTVQKGSSHIAASQGRVYVLAPCPTSGTSTVHVFTEEGKFLESLTLGGDLKEKEVILALGVGSDSSIYTATNSGIYVLKKGGKTKLLIGGAATDFVVGPDFIFVCGDELKGYDLNGRLRFCHMGSSPKFVARWKDTVFWYSERDSKTHEAFILMKKHI